MRIPKYLSYSGMSLFYKDPEAFYLRYLVENRPPREPQTAPMAVGSAFDAFVKAYLFERLVGRKDAQYEKQALFETQVEEQARDQAWKDGTEVFDFYKKTGALADLVLDMEGCIGEPRFETEVTGLVGITSRVGTVPILGKPDIFFVTKDGARIIFDWKVNGFYSNSPPSPKTGYLKMFPGRGMHAMCMPHTHRGFTVNARHPLNMVDKEWAAQLSTYAWVLGEEIGSDYITIVDQIVCNKHTRNHRVARHSCLVQDKFQLEVFDKYHKCWNAIQSGHVFTNLSYDENLSKMKTLDMIVGSQIAPDAVFDSLTAPPKQRWR
jgi:hypothetical protein